MLRHGVRLAVATVAVAAAGLVVPGPAEAATCSTASGVSVVVDFHQLGGGAQTFCDSGGSGENAEQQMADAGFSLTLVDGEDFVCRIDDKPVTDCSRTPPGNAYWSLWWSDGKSGEWKYSSVGGGSLKVPDGGYVAFSWQGQMTQAKPRVTPVSHSTPAPSSVPTSHATSHPTLGSHSSSSPPAPAPTSTAPSEAGSSSTAVALPTSRHTVRHGRRRARHPTKTASAGASKASSRRSAQATGPVAQVATGSGGQGGSGSGGLPGWVAPTAIGLLFAASGTVLLVRRRGSGGG